MNSDRWCQKLYTPQCNRSIVRCDKVNQSNVRGVQVDVLHRQFFLALCFLRQGTCGDMSEHATPYSNPNFRLSPILSSKEL